jgi:hypothetical protein
MNPRRIVWAKERAHHRFLELNPTDADINLINAQLQEAARSLEPIGARLEFPGASAPEPPAWVISAGKWRIVYELTGDEINVLLVDQNPPERVA